MMMAGEEKWYFNKEQLENSPSRRCNIDSDKELSYRQQAANFIQDVGQRLHVSQLCINTAIVYMHRFYVFHSFTQFHRYSMASAALFLAAKVEELPRKLEHVVKVAQVCLNKEDTGTNGPAPDVKSELYAQAAHDLVFNENVLLQTLGFDVAIDHPHTHVVRCCQLVKASKDLAQTSYFLASNSLHLTTMCLQYKPTVVACFCIYLACKWSNWKISPSSEGKQWFTYVDEGVTDRLLDELTSEFMVIYNKCPSRLKKKVESMSNSQDKTPAPSAGLSGSSSGSNYNSPLAIEQKKSQQGQHNKEDQSKHPSKPGAPHAHRPHPDPNINYAEYKEKKERERQMSGGSGSVIPHHKQTNSSVDPSKHSSSLPHKHGMPPGSVPPQHRQHHRNPNDPKLKGHPPPGHPHSSSRPSSGQPYPPHGRPPTDHRDPTTRPTSADPHREGSHRDPHREMHPRDPNRARDITAPRDPMFPGKEPPKDLFATSALTTEREIQKEQQARERHNQINNIMDPHQIAKDNLFKESDRPRERPVDPHYPNNVHKHRPDLFNNKDSVSELNKDSDKLRFEQKQKVDPNKLSSLPNAGIGPQNIVKHDNRHRSGKDIPSDVTKPHSKSAGGYEQKKPLSVDKSVKSNSYSQSSGISQNRVKPPYVGNLQEKPMSVPSPTLPRNGNHNIVAEVEKRPEIDAMPHLQPNLPVKVKSIFSPEKEIPKELPSPTKRSSKTGKTSPSSKKVDLSTDFNMPPALSPFGSPPPLSAEPNSKNRNRTSSSSSEAELVPVVNKLEFIKGYEHMGAKDNQKGFKLPKVEGSSSRSPIKEKKQNSVPSEDKKPIKQEIEIAKCKEEPLINGAETDPAVISNLLKEMTPMNHLSVADVKEIPKEVVPMEETIVPSHDGRKSEHHRSDKKKKKDKHKHKDKERSREEKEKKKKHKDKDKDRERSKKVETPADNSVAPLKITIAKDKITPPPSVHQKTPSELSTPVPTSLKIKIPKDRIKTDTLPMLNNSQGSGSLKITISKDKIVENVETSNSSSRKRERELSESQGPASKISKSSYSSSRSDSSRQNGRNYHKSQVSLGEGGQVGGNSQPQAQWNTQVKLAESKYHSKVSGSNKQPPA